MMVMVDVAVLMVAGVQSRKGEPKKSNISNDKLLL